MLATLIRPIVPVLVAALLALLTLEVVGLRASSVLGDRHTVGGPGADVGIIDLPHPVATAD